MMDYITDLKSSGGSMGGFVFLLYSIATDYLGGINNILEIGVRSGVSTKAFLYGLQDSTYINKGHLYSIDKKNCSMNGVKGLEYLWTFIQGDSKVIEWDREIDVLLIDGDHKYDGVKADYEKYEPFVKKGGLILMHDVLYMKGVSEVFDNEVKYHKTVLPLSKAGMGIIYKR